MEPLKFGLLGPLEVRSGGRVIPVASPKHRTMVARLLLDNGRPVSTAALAEAIWGDTQPENPRRALQVIASRLRAQLAPFAAGELITTSTDGYAIAVADDQVDVGRFASYTAEAALAAERGDPDDEADALAAGLALWRGEPLADIPSESLRQQAVPGLREQWLVAVERRVDCDLRRGRASEVVGELRGLTARHPMREALWALLIRAMDRSGRRTEALDAYHTARRHLLDELGVEPGEELRRLHASLLTGRVDEPRSAAMALPRQLPPELPGFVGRTRELARLRSIVDGGRAGARIVVIGGMPGVGKTVLATRWARRATDHFPDGQLWADLRGDDAGQALPPGPVLARFLRALGLPDEKIPQEVEEQAALYRSLLDGRRMLVVLDNAHSADQVRPLLPGGPGCVAVVTCRRPLTDLVIADGALPVTLDALTVAEAEQLLAYRVGVDRIAGQPQAVRDIVRSCARLPLALAIVGARAAGQPHLGLGELAGQLRDARRGLDALTAGDSGIDIRAVFSWSYGTLSADAARLFRLVGLHPGPDLSAPAAASLAALPVRRVVPLLAELARAHLLAEPDLGRYAQHDLMRAYAAELVRAVDPEPARWAAVGRMLDHYTHSAVAAARGLYPQRDFLMAEPVGRGVTPETIAGHDEALAWFAREHATLVDLVACGSDAHTWRLSFALAHYLEMRCYWLDWESVARSAVTAARRLADPTARAISLRSLARSCMQYPTAGSFLTAGGSPSPARVQRLGRAHDYLGQAIELFRRSGDGAGLGLTYINLGHLSEERGEFRAALDAARRALDAFAQAGHRRGHAFSANAVGFYLAMLGDYEGALPMCEHAFAELEELGDREGTSATCDSLGLIHHKLGNHAAAVEWYGRAIDHYAKVGHAYLEAYSRVGLGDAFVAAGDRAAAAETWRRAHDLLAELDDADADAVRSKLDSLAGDAPRR